MSVFKRGGVYGYHFLFAGRHLQESAKTRSKTLAKAAEQKRRRDLEDGFNSLTDDRKERVRSLADVAADYLEDYKLRNRSGTFAEHALKHVTRLLGTLLIVDISERPILGYQSARLKREGRAEDN